jgi:predicted alpha-1,2-mannosidase
MKKSAILALGSLLVPLLQLCAQPAFLTDRVNPFIGTGGHGHTYPGASMPFGMVQLSPDTRTDGWDACSGYYAADTVILGFSHTHLSGTGCSDYGDILVMPVTGNVSLEKYGYASHFKASDEVASPGYYRVDLGRYHITAELTAALRAGFHRYTFPASQEAGIVFDLKHRDKVLESSLKINGNNEIEGMRISQAWAEKQILYFVARFSKPFSSFTVSGAESADNTHPTNPLPTSREGKTEGRGGFINEYSGDSIRALFRFETAAGEKILVKVGISAVSIEGARKNLEAEIPGWDFDKAGREAAFAWNRELGKIRVEGGTQDQQVVFYTSLYHAMLNPNLYMDVDGSYRARDLQIHKADGFDYYTVFSLWDTYRAEHPLFTIIDQKRTGDFINTFIRQYQQGGMLPVWELSANETGCMIGYHAVPVIADACLKGIRGFNALQALEAMKNSANQDKLGLPDYRMKGYIPADRESESVSKTLEYAYDDWCIAQMAKALGVNADYSEFIRRAQSYRNIYDKSTGFMRAKLNETWFSPFDPAEVNFNYTEANAWQYSFYVPQDITGLMGLMGGPGKFSKKLDDLFNADTKSTGREQADISGLIGQYAHGNEPSHHMAYLYDYAGEPWKTQALVHRIQSTLYSNSRDGLCGNEDCGQMSAWLVLSAMGFYPVTPGSGIYAIGTPMFPKVAIQLENRRTFTIIAKNLSDKNFYIQSATIDGREFSKCYLTHSTIMNGGEMVLVMGPEPNKQWGSHEGDFPVSSITDDRISTVPSVDKGSRTFLKSTTVSLSSPDPSAVIHYTLDGSAPTEKSPVYKSSFEVSSSTKLKAFSKAPGLPESPMIEASFLKIPKNRSITIHAKYAPQYSAGGDLALIDFLRGGPDFRTGSWQGYEGVDLDAVIDLGQPQEIHSISAGFLQDEGSWIFMPVEVDFFISTDGKEYKAFQPVINDVPERDPGTVVKDFTVKTPGEKARFIKVTAKNRGTCPPWHVGAGSKAWIFADEISVE